MAVTLILGGARSGKSKRAEALAKASGLPVCYVATSPSFEEDAEWQARIKKHQAQRPKSWQLIEEPLALPALFTHEQDVSQFIIVDCLTLWLSNLLYANQDVQSQADKLCAALKQYQGDVVLVSNEVGLGLVPESELGRSFRDAQGRLNQDVAAIADHVEFVAAGIPIPLK
jgi:adenosylcobinamide kinase/adenosylcobinamide-phosphate guanylyltransferase